MLIFVYGKMKHNGKLHYLLEKAKYVDIDETSPNYTMLHLTPAPIPIVVARGITSIKGEIYSVESDVYDKVLKYENVPVFSVPKLIRTKKGHECVMFVISPSLTWNMKEYIKKYPKIESGEWHEPSGALPVQDKKCEC